MMPRVCCAGLPAGPGSPAPVMRSGWWLGERDESLRGLSGACIGGGEDLSDGFDVKGALGEGFRVPLAAWDAEEIAAVDVDRRRVGT